MRINSVSATTKYQNNTVDDSKKTSFKSGGAIGLAGTIMQGIENQGYFLSFIIQDGLGMTVPRVWTGFNRDKEITGKYNTQEGFEVLYREGLTGPYIIAVAPIVLWLTTKFCRSTNTNTNLIKRYGNALKEFAKDTNLSKAIGESTENFKKKFAKYNIENIYKKTVPNDKDAQKTIELILKEFENLSSKDKKTRNEAINKINEIINEKILETSPECLKLNKIIVGEGEAEKAFNTKEALKALSDFCEDAIVKNSEAKNITEEAAENIKNNFITKRLLTNIANIALTLGGLSLIPKIYAKNDVAPSAQVMLQMKEQMQTEKEKEQNIENTAEPSFKGRGINSKGLFSKIGGFLSKYVPEKFNELFEYMGINFSKTMFACLSLFGLLLPRGKKALDRAQVDENGKKDLSELKEILLRDTVSSLSVVFAVPILTKVFVNSYEGKLGFVLTNKGSEGKSAFKKFLDVINPYSNLEVLSLADLDAIYGNIDSKAKLMNFAEFINKNGGDLEKILSKSENVKEMFNEKTFTLDSIKNLTKQEKNRRIIELFKNIEASDPKAKNELISKVMKGSGNIKSNKIAQMVRGLNSLPGLISTFIISPVLLGVLIPKLTYSNTRKAQEKILNESKKSVSDNEKSEIKA